MGDGQLETYDAAAFERFCSGLVNEGFSPVRNTGQARWTGPIRTSLRLLTDATRMQIWIPPGWPLRYARVTVDGLKTEHAAQGTICLWADDDPAQIAGRELQALWDRLDEWAVTAQQGFRLEDRALDAYLLFNNRSTYQAELPFRDLIRSGRYGSRAALVARKQGDRTLMIEPASGFSEPEDGEPSLRGAFYLRRHMGPPPRDFEDVRASLTRKQLQDLDRGLACRAPDALPEPRGGYDFIVLAWARHDREHDAVVVAFEGHGDTLKASAVAATPNDISARQRRAGPDTSHLSHKKVLIAGVGSVGGHVSIILASSGVGTIRLHDSDYLKTANLVRHAGDRYGVGYEKVIVVAIEIKHHAPWTKVEPVNENLPYAPSRLLGCVEGFDLVIDCTGNFALSAALAEVCRRADIPFLSGALFHQGSVARIQRQASGDTPIAARPADPEYYELPPEDATAPDSGFLELGCTAPINNAPPAAVFATASDIAHAAVDFLTGRQERADERIVVFRAMGAPFDRTGTFDSPARRTSA